MNISKMLGSTLIIAGTALGGGMLALPLASAGLGFTTATILIVANWILMTYTALLMLEVHQYAPADYTLNSLAKKLLGKPGQYLATFASLFLFYALCSAYIAGGGSQMGDKINHLLSLDLAPQFGPVVFTLVIGAIVSIGTHSVDMVNRVLFCLKIVALILMLKLLLPHVQTLHLMAMPLQQGLMLSALPVIFTSFGFHGSIPSIVRYVGLDIKMLKKVMILGASAPLCIYLLWQLATHGVISQSDLMANNSLSGFIQVLSQVLHHPAISQTVSVFADLALATSFLGVSLGLFDLISKMLKRSDCTNGRLQTAMVTFLPPLGFALFYPQGFITALGYAAIALVILGVFLPVAMVFKQRKCNEQQTGYRVGGGSLMLIIATLSGCIVIAAQFLQIAGLIPAAG